MNSMTDIELMTLRQEVEQLHRDVRGLEVFVLLTGFGVIYLLLQLFPTDLIVRVFGGLYIYDLAVWFWKNYVKRRR